MISRRNIRVKAIQVLYSLETMQESTSGKLKNNLEEAERQMLEHIRQSSQIFIHLLYTISQVAGYADIHARQRASKYLRSEADLHVNTKIVNNDLILQLNENEAFNIRVKEYRLPARSDKDLIKKLFQRFQETEYYKNYIQEKEVSLPKEEKWILLHLFNDLLMTDEDFDQYIGDLYLQWQDDKDMMKMLVGNYFNKPTSFNFKQLISREKREYAMELVQTVLQKKESSLNWIRPRLQNWDPERVAIIDMLLLEMGVCEFLYFPSIPPKVTINEYIDLAKEYSTLQSGQFINGVLDNILKDLKKKGKLNKTEKAQK